MGGDILIVNDEYGVILTQLLQAAGYPVHHARNAEGAWEELLRNPVSLVLTDYLLPVVDGCQLISRMRDSRTLEKTPVLMITALLEEVVRDKCEFSSFLRKPFTAAELLDKVHHILGPPQ